MLLSISSAKGGSGKSTLTSILGTSLFSNYGLNVCIVDIDPQMSIIENRKKELKEIKDSPPHPSSKVYQAISRNNQKMAKPFVDVYAINLYDDFKVIHQNLIDLQKKYDVVFVDFPGSLNLHTNTLQLLRILDLILIPYYVDQNNNNSTLQFLSALIGLKGRKEIKADFYLFFNKYSETKNTALFNAAKEFLKNSKLPLLKSTVWESTEIERYSTIIPLALSPYKKNIGSFVFEVLELIKKY